MAIFYSILFFFLGAALGSFATAITHRIANKESWILSDNKAARSSCLNCKRRLRFFDLFPILSWVCLKGRCRYCKVKISSWYPKIEIVSALISLILFLAIGWQIQLLFLLLLLPFGFSQLLLLLNKSLISLQLMIIMGVIITVYYITIQNIDF